MCLQLPSRPSRSFQTQSHRTTSASARGSTMRAAITNAAVRPKPIASARQTVGKDPLETRPSDTGMLPSRWRRPWTPTGCFPKTPSAPRAPLPRPKSPSKLICRWPWRTFR
ncbi:hypothetical protein BD310DRAFT_938847 [Dichomitus squalens]|uniref:Uncharacterized protein n=1 Tax=Dichomitus squalens TaxID=114155 RepID=A0A4Q9PDV2_9APHY|nr:hypothetical protein BD310DRAFT_938847 [Dichomitus squalens]